MKHIVPPPSQPSSKGTVDHEEAPSRHHHDSLRDTCAGARYRKTYLARQADLGGQSGHSEGGQVSILTGDPTKAGDTVVQRVLFPANYEVPPHTHPYSETVTVISGELGFGMGEKLNKTGPMLGVGAFLSNPAKHAHYVWTTGQPAIIQVQFIAPGGIDYINPADDPRKQ